MDNWPFVDGLPIKNGGFSMAMLDYRKSHSATHAAVPMHNPTSADCFHTWYSHFLVLIGEKW